MVEVEIRTVEGGDLRVESRGMAPVIRGYAIVYNRLSELLGFFQEEIAPEAVSRTLTEGVDLRALIDHDPRAVLGRIKAGTLRVETDGHGLRVEVDPTNTPGGHRHRDVDSPGRHQRHVLRLPDRPGPVGSDGGSAHSDSHRHARAGSVGGHVPGVPADGGRSAVPDSGPAGSGRPVSPGPDGGRAARLGDGPRPLTGRPESRERPTSLGEWAARPHQRRALSSHA